MMTSQVTNLLLLLLLVFILVLVIRTRRLFAVVVLSSAYSLVSAAMFVNLDAVDVAFTEAAVGAGISSIMFFCAMAFLPGTQKPESARKGRLQTLSAFVICVFAGLLLVAAALELPAIGEPYAPAHIHVVPRYLEESRTFLHIPNVVTTVLASYRGFDTLGETVVVFTAGLGVLLLLAGATGTAALEPGAKIKAPPRGGRRRKGPARRGSGQPGGQIGGLFGGQIGGRRDRPGTPAPRPAGTAGTARPTRPARPADPASLPARPAATLAGLALARAASSASDTKGDDVTAGTSGRREATGVLPGVLPATGAQGKKKSAAGRRAAPRIGMPRATAATAAAVAAPAKARAKKAAPGGGVAGKSASEPHVLDLEDVIQHGPGPDFGAKTAGQVAGQDAGRADADTANEKTVRPKADLESSDAEATAAAIASAIIKSKTARTSKAARSGPLILPVKKRPPIPKAKKSRTTPAGVKKATAAIAQAVKEAARAKAAGAGTSIGTAKTSEPAFKPQFTAKAKKAAKGKPELMESAATTPAATSPVARRVAAAPKAVKAARKSPAKALPSRKSAPRKMTDANVIILRKGNQGTAVDGDASPGQNEQKPDFKVYVRKSATKAKSAAKAKASRAARTAGKLASKKGSPASMAAGKATAKVAGKATAKVAGKATTKRAGKAAAKPAGKATGRAASAKARPAAKPVKKAPAARTARTPVGNRESDNG